MVKIKGHPVYKKITTVVKVSRNCKKLRTFKMPYGYRILCSDKVGTTVNSIELERKK